MVKPFATLTRAVLLLLSAARFVLVVALAACADPQDSPMPEVAHAFVAGATVPGRSDRALPPAAPRTTYGTPQRIGRGTVRAYLIMDPKDTDRPLEVGVAMSEGAMQGLPAARPKPAADAHGAHGGHETVDAHTLLLDLPARNRTSYTFVQFDWNPAGHEPPGVYDEPHFDFHFWTAPRRVRESIVPGAPDFEANAADLPPEAYRMPFYIDAATAAQAPAHLATVPLMGMHWIDVRSPELQGLAGHPERQERLTRTFIYGSWGGRWVFVEPMITRAHIMSKRSATDPAMRDEVVPISVPPRVQQRGYHPTAYRITWDEREKEYRIALVGFEWRD